MKILKALLVFALLAFLIPLESTETIHRVTALRVESSEGDWVGKGRSYLYQRGDGDFSVCTTDRRRIEVRFSNGSDDWFLAFSVPDDELLEPGTYEDAERYSYAESENPGLSIEANNRGYDRSIGEFEILEIEYGMGNQIESFAANFTQRSAPDAPPLTGSIRFNSRAPLTARFQYPEQALIEYYTIGQNTDEKHLVEASAIEGSEFLQILPMDSENNRIKVLFEWEGFVTGFVFTVPIDQDSGLEKYEFTDCNSPLMHPMFFPTEMSGCDHLTFELTKLERDPDGKILALTFNFTVIDRFGGIIEGKIHRSNLLNPWVVSPAE